MQTIYEIFHQATNLPLNFQRSQWCCHKFLGCIPETQQLKFKTQGQKREKGFLRNWQSPIPTS